LDHEAEHPSGLCVDDQLKFGRLDDRQIPRLGAPEDAADIRADLTEAIRDVRSELINPPTSINWRVV
jgi:hypothetical protein